MISILTHLRDMSSISTQWDELAVRFNSPTLQYKWCSAGAEALLHSDQLRIVVSQSHDLVTGVAPLVLTASNGPQRLEMLGERVLNEPTGFLYDSDKSLHELSAAVLAMGHPLLLKRLRSGSPEVETLCRQHPGRCFLRTDSGSPFIEFDGTWDEFTARMSSDNRNHLRRKRALLEKRGSVTLDVVSPNLTKIDHDLEEIIRVEAKGWKGKQQTAMAFDPPLRRFYEVYVRETGRHGTLRLSFLRVDGKAIAAQIAVVCASRWWLLKVAYDEEWCHFSPGVLLTHESIRHAYQEGLKGFEFLGHDEAWIHRWTRLLRPYVTLRCYPLSVGGIRAFAVDSCKALSRRSSLSSAGGTIRRAMASGVSKATQQIASKYIAGWDVEDAIRICRKIDPYGWNSTICPWDAPNETAGSVAYSYLKALTVIGDTNLDCYLSIKPPALQYDWDLLKRVLDLASEHNVRVHFDALAPETAAASFALLERAAGVYRNLGCTLPSRWRRSIADAEKAIELQAAVRVVKGQWPDPAEPDLDPRARFLELIDVLAGRIQKVAVASHDVALATASISKLQTTQTKCELEQLFGLPLRIDNVAIPLNIGVRLYVPYRYGYLPYALSGMIKHPVIIGWILRDLVVKRDPLSPFREKSTQHNLRADS